MTNKSNKRKFLATTLTATMVAAAVAPVAGAAEVDKASFPDVPADHAYAGVIADMANAGVIEGEPNGNFNLGGQITRAEAAQMVAGLLDLPTGEEGNKTNFEDVKGNVWYTGAINSLVAKGIVAGKTATLFAPSANITRGELAQLLVEAYGLQDVNVDDVDLPFTDVAEDAWFATPIKILHSQGLIKGQTTTKFGPKEDMKRGDFAWLAANIDYAHGEKLPKPVATVQSVSVINATTLSVTLSDGSVHEVELEEALRSNVETEVTFTINEVEYTSTVTWEVKAPIVESVSAINATQLLVKFNAEVGDDATAWTSYSVTDLDTATTNTVQAIEVLEDGKSVVLSLATPYRVATDVAVIVDGVYKKGSIKETFPRFAQTVTINDTKLPEIVSAVAKTNTNEAQSVTVVLSEPVKPTTLFKVNGQTVSATPSAPSVERAANDEEVATVYLLSGIELETGKTHSVEMINAEDYADNKSDEIITKSFSVTKDTAAATGKITGVQDNKVKVVFDKAITETSLTNVKLFNYDGGTFTTLTPDTVTAADNAGKEWIFDLTTEATNAPFYDGINDSTEDILVRVQTGVVDTAGNQVATFDGNVTLTEDVTGPELQEVTFDKNSKGEVTKLYFSFDELLDDSGSAVATIANTNINVIDKSNNNSVDFTDLFGPANSAVLATDNKTLVVTVDPSALGVVTSGSYEFELVGGTTEFVVKDSALALNENKGKAVSVNFGNTANQVTATVTTTATYTAGATPEYVGAANAQAITVLFSKPVTAASAINPANYTFAGKALPNGTVIVYDEANTSATFTLPMDYIAESDAEAIVQVRNIKPIDSSYTFKNYSDVHVAIDNTRPVAIPSIVTTGEIKLTFNEVLGTAFTGGVEADFASLVINGKVIDAGEYAITADTDTNTGLSIAMVTVNATEDVVDGFIYQFIDVDGNTNYDPTIDIQLRRAAGTVAPASWAADNDIAKLNLSAVTSVELSTIASPTFIVDVNGTATGNAIKGSSLIKVK